MSRGEVDCALLREVSRSFSISLELLPEGMRRPVSLAYLLARASDTLADTTAVSAGERLERLDGFIGEMNGGEAEWRRELGGFCEKQSHAGERRLLEGLEEVMAGWRALPERQRAMVGATISTITSGQRLDLERTVLTTAAELEDYCWRVAGCVGEFWTRIGFETLGARFSAQPEDRLMEWGREFGSGLQLVNILRDAPKDLAAGRRYLPVEEEPGGPTIRRLWLPATEWRPVAMERMEAGKRYAKALKIRRLRAATVLPALIGERTLEALGRADEATWAAGVKVDRRTVRRCLWRALWW